MPPTNGLFDHVSRNQPLRFRADRHNAWQDAAAAHAAKKVGGPPGAAGQTNVILDITNNTGADIPINGVLEINGLQIEPTYNDGILQNHPILDGQTPSGSDVPIAITLQPARDGDTVQAVVVGVVPCKVDVQDTDHQFAVPTNGENAKLESATTGGVRILYKPAATGDQDCLVQLPVSGGAARLEFLWSNLYSLDHSEPETDPLLCGGGVGYTLLPCFERVVAKAPSTQSEAEDMDQIGAANTFWAVDTDDETGDLDLLIVKRSGATQNRSGVVCTMEQVAEEAGGSGAPFWYAWPVPQTGHTDPLLTNSTPQTDAITGGDQGDREVEISSDKTGDYTAGIVVRWSDSSSGTNDGLYTVQSSSHAGGTTTVVLVESIPGATIDGNLNIDAEYLVPDDDTSDPTEYTIIGVDTGNDEFDILGDHTDVFEDQAFFRVVGSYDFSGGYVCDGDSTEAGGVTTITVEENLPNISRSVNEIFSGTKTIRLTGDYSTEFADDDKIMLQGTDYNDDVYTVNGTPTYDALNDWTDIVVDESLTNENNGNGFAYNVGTLVRYPIRAREDVPLPDQDVANRASSVRSIYDLSTPVWFSPRSILAGDSYPNPTIYARDGDTRPIIVSGQYSNQFGGYSSWPVIRNLHLSRIDTTLCPSGCLFARWAGFGRTIEFYFRHHVTDQLYRGEIEVEEIEKDAGVGDNFMVVTGNVTSNTVTLRVPWKFDADDDLLYQEFSLDLDLLAT